MKHFTVVIEPAKSNFAAYSPDVPGCVATGSTVEETLAEMKSALVFHFEGMQEAGEPLPQAQGLEWHLQSGEYVAEPGDLIANIAANELFDLISTEVPVQ